MKVLFLVLSLSALAHTHTESTAPAEEKHLKPKGGHGGYGTSQFVQPYSCELGKPYDPATSQRFMPNEAIEFGLVTPDKERGGWKIAETDLEHAQCEPLVYDLRKEFKDRPKREFPTYLGVLCADETTGSKKVKEDDKDKTEYVRKRLKGSTEGIHPEDQGNTFQTAEACGMPNQFKFYAVRFSKEANKFLRIALPCLKQLDDHTRPKACFERREGVTRDMTLTDTDAIAAKNREAHGEPARPENSDPALKKLASDVEGE